jgi:PKD repeat protein
VPGTVELLEPLARMVVRPRRGNAPLTLEFKSFSRDPAGGGLSHRWLLNDSQFSDLESGSHTINASGIHELTLVVRDSLGRASSSTTFVVVDP